MHKNAGKNPAFMISSDRPTAENRKRWREGGEERGHSNFALSPAPTQRNCPSVVERSPPTAACSLFPYNTAQTFTLKVCVYCDTNPKSSFAGGDFAQSCCTFDTTDDEGQSFEYCTHSSVLNSVLPYRRDFTRVDASQ